VDADTSSTYITNMKPIQVMMDDELLSALDATDEVMEEGRSAVLRRAVAEYLARKRRDEIRDQYERAYGQSAGLGEDFSGWEDEGEWANG
jgi:predicted transcriptional regulator